MIDTGKQEEQVQVGKVTRKGEAKERKGKQENERKKMETAFVNGEGKQELKGRE